MYWLGVFLFTLAAIFVFLMGWTIGFFAGMKRANDLFLKLDDMVKDTGSIPKSYSAPAAKGPTGHFLSSRYFDPPPDSRPVPAGMVRIEDDEDTIPGVSSPSTWPKSLR